MDRYGDEQTAQVALGGGQLPNSQLSPQGNEESFQPCAHSQTLVKPAYVESTLYELAMGDVV